MFRGIVNFSLLSLLSLLAGCQLSQTQIEENVTGKTSTESNTISTSITAAIDILKTEPDWLFPYEKCPGEVMTKVEVKVDDFAKKDCISDPVNCLLNCRNQVGNTCYGLALLLQEQKIENKYSEALFLRSCKLGITSGCTNRAAGMLNSEKNSDDALKCIAETFAKTCDRKDSWGCTMRGWVLSQGIGCDLDIDEALVVLQKACSQNPDTAACRYAKNLQEKILQAE